MAMSSKAVGAAAQSLAQSSVDLEPSEVVRVEGQLAPRNYPGTELETLSSSIGTPAVRFAIQSFTSAVTQSDACPTFLGRGNAPSAMYR